MRYCSPLARLPAAALALAALAGCNDLEVCGSRREDVLGADGAAVRCVTTDECPLGSRVTACLSDATPEQECVTCEDTRCVRTIPERCQ